MNLFKSIQKIVEKETGLTCVYEQHDIQDNQVAVSIREIQKTGIDMQYQVNGSFSIKIGTNLGWQVLKDILNLSIADMRASCSFYSETSGGFSVMSVDYSVLIKDEEKRIFPIKLADIKEND